MIMTLVLVPRLWTRRTHPMLLHIAAAPTLNARVSGTSMLPTRPVSLWAGVSIRLCGRGRKLLVWCLLRSVPPWCPILPWNLLTVTLLNELQELSWAISGTEKVRAPLELACFWLRTLWLVSELGRALVRTGNVAPPLLVVSMCISGLGMLSLLKARGWDLVSLPTRKLVELL